MIDIAVLVKRLPEKLSVDDLLFLMNPLSAGSPTGSE
jgi:hypothetical protein